ncbi:hypothetical protein EDC04DRAFT_2613905 [Pisolithus marmoratus]|nr:hypothetical protein EDC04DRAFT_2613905 [Pisolithus marmoratus]
MPMPPHHYSFGPIVMEDVKWISVASVTFQISLRERDGYICFGDGLLCTQGQLYPDLDMWKVDELLDMAAWWLLLLDLAPRGIASSSLANCLFLLSILVPFGLEETSGIIRSGLVGWRQLGALRGKEEICAVAVAGYIFGSSKLEYTKFRGGRRHPHLKIITQLSASPLLCYASRTPSSYHSALGDGSCAWIFNSSVIAGPSPKSSPGSGSLRWAEIKSIARVIQIESEFLGGLECNISLPGHTFTKGLQWLLYVQEVLTTAQWKWPLYSEKPEEETEKAWPGSAGGTRVRCYCSWVTFHPVVGGHCMSNENCQVFLIDFTALVKSCFSSAHLECALARDLQQLMEEFMPALHSLVALELAMLALRHENNSPNTTSILLSLTNEEVTSVYQALGHLEPAGEAETLRKKLAPLLSNEVDSEDALLLPKTVARPSPDALASVHYASPLQSPVLWIDSIRNSLVNSQETFEGNDLKSIISWCQALRESDVTGQFLQMLAGIQLSFIYQELVNAEVDPGRPGKCSKHVIPSMT